MRGGSQAHLIRASDNNFYVTKFSNNPQHTRILANEFLGGKLGLLLGLPMPEVRILEVSEWLVEHTPELNIETGLRPVRCSSGLQVGSRYVTDPQQASVFDYLPESMLEKVVNSQDFARVLVFDKWTGNADGRQSVFVKQGRGRSYRAMFIDQGHCFNAGEWSFSDSSLRGTYARNIVYENVRGWESFEPVLSKAEQVDPAELWNIAREVPPVWYQHDTERISSLIETLYQRRSLIRELISDFRNSNRNPFPNWLGF
jgi:hypothetical protein